MATEGDTSKPTAQIIGSKKVYIKKNVLLQMMKRHLDKRISLDAQLTLEGDEVCIFWPENETLNVKL